MSLNDPYYAFSDMTLFYTHTKRRKQFWAAWSELLVIPDLLPAQAFLTLRNKVVVVESWKSLVYVANISGKRWFLLPKKSTSKRWGVDTVKTLLFISLFTSAERAGLFDQSEHKFSIICLSDPIMWSLTSRPIRAVHGKAVWPKKILV